MKHLKVRIPMYFIGLFVMTIGIALSVKSNLGVSPVSSIPYTMTCVWGIEMGKATILFHMVLVLIQILLLRKKFKPVQLLQVLVGVVFGYFTTFCNYMVSFLPTPENLGIRIIMVLASTVFVAFGIFLYLPADLPTAYHVFVSADATAETARVSARDNISPEAAAAKVKKANHERAVHCKHFTKTDWGNVKNYDLSIKSDDFGVAETAQIIGDLFQKKMGLS